MGTKTRFPGFSQYENERVDTTFWNDFTIADGFGPDAVLDTFGRAFGEWKSNHKYLTELVLVLNHKLWQHYELGDEAMARLYDNLWHRANNWGMENLKGDELEFFLWVLD